MPVQSPEALQKRRNVVLFLVLALLALAVGLYPRACTYVQQPQAYYETAAEAPVRPDGFLPQLIPPSATEIHERRDRSGARVWTRFRFAPADMERMTAGKRRLTLDEAKRVQIVAPAFSPWWTLNPSTFQGSQGRVLRMYEVTGDDAGWLVVDPRSMLAFYWSR